MFTEHEELLHELETSRERILTNQSNGGRTPARTPRVSQLAVLTGAESEYTGLYKLYSKYAHPSAYLLFSSKAEKEAESSLSVFRHRAYVYAHQAVNTYGEVQELFDDIYA